MHGAVLSAEMKKCVLGGARENSDFIWETELVPILNLHVLQLALVWYDTGNNQILSL